MIDDIRIGNLLFYDETIYSYGIHREYFLADVRFLKQYYCALENGDSDYYDMIAPVELKKEHLLLLGFKVSGEHYYDVSIGKRKILTVKPNQNCFQIGYGSEWTDKIYQAKYVHQIQNAFRFLAGFDLDPKDLINKLADK